MNDKDIRTIGILKTMYQEERNLIGTDITNTNYTHRDKAQAIENLLKENEELKMKIHFINNNNLDDLYEKTLEKTMTKFLNDNIEKDFIPVAKIKEEMELMQESIKNNDYSDDTNLINCSICDTEIVIDYLNKLLSSEVK